MAKKKKEEKPLAVVEYTPDAPQDETLTDFEGNAIDPEVLAQARVDMRAAMREKFDKWITVYDEDATEEDLQSAREYFESEVEKYKNQSYQLAEGDKAVPVVMFLKNWNANYNQWKNAAWRGVIAFDKVMDKALADLEVESNKVTSLEVDYQTLMFLYHQMQVPMGTGLDTALAMAELENFDLEKAEIRNDGKVTYTSILATVYEHVNRLSLVDKKLNLLRERVTLAAAGIKFDFKISELEEYKEMSDAWVVTNEEVENATKR